MNLKNAFKKVSKGATLLARFACAIRARFACANQLYLCLALIGLSSCGDMFPSVSIDPKPKLHVQEEPTNPDSNNQSNSTGTGTGTGTTVDNGPPPPVPCAPTFTCSLKLAWDDYSDPSARGFFIKYGTSSGNYTKSIDIGFRIKNTYRVEGLGLGTYYFIIVAYGNYGIESLPSNEAVGTITNQSVAQSDPPPAL